MKKLFIILITAMVCVLAFSEEGLCWAEYEAYCSMVGVEASFELYSEAPKSVCFGDSEEGVLKLFNGDSNEDTEEIPQ